MEHDVEHDVVKRVIERRVTGVSHEAHHNGGGLIEHGRAEWRGQADIDLVERTLGSVLVERADEHPDRAALVGVPHGADQYRTWTYAQLLDDARRVAGGLLSVADPVADPGDPVALWAPNVAEWPIIQYGAALAGVTLVALNPVLRTTELAYALRKSGARALLHADKSRDYDMAATAGQVAGDISKLEHVVSLSDHDRVYGDPVDGTGRAQPDDIAMMQFTSGTTGDPKGVLLKHRSLINNARLTLHTAEVPSATVCVNPLPMFHTASCVIGTLGPLWIGGTEVLVRDFDPRTVLELLAAHDASLLFAVPAILGAVHEASRAMEDIPQLDTVLVGASTVPRSLIEAVNERFGAAVHNLYGQTELSPVLSLTRRSDTSEDLVTSVGRPLPHTDVRIVNPTTRDVVDLGEEGEVCARGYLTMVGYHDDEEATSATVDADGYVHTGDLGSMDERGMITLTGRLKELIIRGGENVAPAEIEVALAAHPDVLQPAVVGLPDERLGEIVAAFVVTRGAPGQGLQESLIAHCRERLSPYKVPSQWFFRDALPMTPSGKVQKFKFVDNLDPDRGG